MKGLYFFILSLTVLSCYKEFDDIPITENREFSQVKFASKASTLYVFYNNYLKVYNCSDPTKPKLVYKTESTISNPEKVYVVGNTLMALNATFNATFDISNPELPQPIYNYTYRNCVSLAKQGNAVYVGLSVNCTDFQNVGFHLSDAINLTFSNGFTPYPMLKEIYIYDSLLYATNRNAGFSMFSLKDNVFNPIKLHENFTSIAKEIIVINEKLIVRKPNSLELFSIIEPDKPRFLSNYIYKQ